MSIRRRGAPFGAPVGPFFKEMPLVSSKILFVTEQQEYSTEKLDFHRILTRLYGEASYFHAEVLALMTHRAICSPHAYERF